MTPEEKLFEAVRQMLEVWEADGDVDFYISRVYDAYHAMHRDR